MASKRELAVAKLTAQSESAPNRYLDMGLSIWPFGRGVEPVLRVGGRWDNVRRRYVDDAEFEVELEIAPSQSDVLDDFAEWLDRYIDYRAHRARGLTPDQAKELVWIDDIQWTAALLYGGRRSGKTFFCLLALTAVAIAIPGSRILIYSPTQQKTQELQDALQAKIIPESWRTWKSAAQTLELANGSWFEFHTGCIQEAKHGEATAALINEAQEISEQVFFDNRGNCSDQSGLVLCAANPPRRPIGLWVSTWVSEVKAKERPRSRSYFVDPRLNPFTDHDAHLGLSEGMDEQTHRREVLGDIGVPIGNLVLSSFSETVNVRDWLPVSWRDVTKQITERYYTRPSDWVIGLDFDIKTRTGCSYAAGRFWAAPDWDIEDAVLWFEYGERKIEWDETELADWLKYQRNDYGDLLFYPHSTIMVGDASGEWQETERNPARSSYAAFRDQKWHVIKPDPTWEKNPFSDLRFETSRQVLRERENHWPLVLFHPRASQLIEAARTYEKTKEGRPKRASSPAHIVDAWSYVAWRRWGMEHKEQRLDRSGGYDGRRRVYRHYGP